MIAATAQPTRRRVSASVQMAIFGVLLTVAGVLWSASAQTAHTRGQVEVHARQIGDHEARIRAVEKTQSEIATDVKWIRRTIETAGPRGGPRP